MADIETIAGVPAGYLTPQQMNSLIMEYLKNSGSTQQQKQPQQFIGKYAPLGVAGELLGDIGRQMQLRKLMGQQNQSEQQKANTLLPGTGSSNVSPSSSPSLFSGSPLGNMGSAISNVLSGSSSPPASQSTTPASSPASLDTSSPPAQSSPSTKTSDSTPDVNNRSIPASIRNNNPGAMWPGPSSQKFGATGSQDLPAGQKIATFSDPISGAAAQFDLMDRRYTGMTLRQAIEKWSGGHSPDEYTNVVAQRSGITPDTIITKDLLRNPQVGMRLAQAMSYHEAGREYPLSPDQWTQAHRMAFGGQAASPSIAPPTPTATTQPDAGATGASTGPVTPPAATSLSAPTSSPAAPTAPSGANPDPFAPRALTPQELKSIGPLPTRPVRNWSEINRLWRTYTPQQQQDLEKEFKDTNGGKNPMVYELPNKAGNLQYMPGNTDQVTFHPVPKVEKTKDAAGNDREFEYVVDPITNSRSYRNGEAPPTAEQVMAGAAKSAGMKTQQEDIGKTANRIYDGAQGLGNTGAKVANIADGILPIVQDKDWRSGGMPETRLALERLKNSLGMNNNATSIEVVRRGLGIMKSYWQEGMKSNTSVLGEQSRLFQSEINSIEPIIGGLDETKEGIASGLKAISRLGNHWKETADAVDEHVDKLPNKLPDRSLNKFIRDREANFHLFNPEDLPKHEPPPEITRSGSGVTIPQIGGSSPTAPPATSGAAPSPAPAAPTLPGTGIAAASGNMPLPGSPPPPVGASMPPEAAQAQQAREIAAKVLARGAKPAGGRQQGFLSTPAGLATTAAAPFALYGAGTAAMSPQAAAVARVLSPLDYHGKYFIPKLLGYEQIIQHLLGK